MNDYERLQKQGFEPRFKIGDLVQTKNHIKPYRKHQIVEIGNIQYLVEKNNGYQGVILFKYEDIWELYEEREV